MTRLVLAVDLGSGGPKVGYVTLTGWTPLLSYLKTVAYSRYSVYDLSVIPMFLLMGQFASRGGLSQSLFNAANAVIGHWRGGVDMAAVGGDLFLRKIVTNGAELLAEFDGQRQADIAEADDGDGGGVGAHGR